MYRVNEIFYTLQGEGRFTGTPAVFLRFSGCNLACGFCDTEFTEYSLLSLDRIVEQVCIFPSRHIVITGGEPLLQLTDSLAIALHEKGFFIQIETNGTLRLNGSLPELVDWVTCSPKSQNIVIQRIDELKVVHTGQALSFYEEMPIEHPECRYLQPCDEGDPVRNAENFARAVDYIKAHPVWKLSLQTHKLTGIK